MCPTPAHYDAGIHFVPSTSEQLDSVDPRLGKRLGDFLLADVIGSGAFGRVYLAYQLPILMRAAVKLMDVRRMDGPGGKASVTRFADEGAALARLNHPNIVRLLKIGTHDDVPYLVMEYVDNATTLKAIIAQRKEANRPFVKEEVVRVLDQVISGLTAAHAMNLVHGDIRPANLILQDLPGHPTFVRLVDFGMSSLGTGSQHLAMSTIGYMAPEQIATGESGPWSDLYALGAVAYEMLTFSSPFSDLSTSEHLERKRTGDLDPMDQLLDHDLSLKEIDFLRQALDPEPARRFRSCDAFRTALYATLREQRADVVPRKPEPLWLDTNVDEKSKRTLPRLDAVTPPVIDVRSVELLTRGNKTVSVNAIRSRIASLEEEGAWEQAIESKMLLLAKVSKSSEQFAVHMSIGDIYRTKLDVPDAARAAYAKARLANTRSRAPLLQLLQLASDAEDYEGSIEYLKNLVALENDVHRKATYAMSIGVIYRDRLRDPIRAVEHFEAALDQDPSRLKAFTAITSLLRGRSPHLMEQCLKRMILRVRNAPEMIDDAPSLLFSLYRDLGKLFEHGLVEHSRAIEAYEVALKLRPLDKEVLDIFVELCVKMGNYSQAAERCRLRIKALRDDFETYRTMIKLDRKTGNTDRAWLVSGLLCALGQTDSLEAKNYAAYAPVPLEDHRQWTQAVWSQLVVGPPGIPRLGPILGVIYDCLGDSFRTDSVKRYGVNPKQKLTSEDSAAVRQLEFIAGVMGTPCPDVYLDERVRGMEILPVLPLAMRMDSEALELASTRKGAFLLAKVLTYLHPSHLLGTLYDDSHVALLVKAALEVAAPSHTLDIPAELEIQPKRTAAKQLNSLVASLQRELNSAQRAALIEAVAPLTQSNLFPEISAWRRLVELTTNHAAVVIAGDINLVAGILRTEDSGSSYLTVGERLKDLVLWILSHRFKEVRSMLNLGARPAETS